MDFLQTLGAVLAANLLTAMFVFGMAKAFRINAGDPAPFAVVASVSIPLVIVGVAAYLWA